MDIYRIQDIPLSSLDRNRLGNHQRTPDAEGAQAAPSERISDRRYQPDRRRRQGEFAGYDRRKRRSRRSPILLDPKTAQAASLEDLRGRLVSTKV